MFESAPKCFVFESNYDDDDEFALSTSVVLLQRYQLETHKAAAVYFLFVLDAALPYQAVRRQHTITSKRGSN